MAQKKEQGKQVKSEAAQCRDRVYQFIKDHRDCRSEGISRALGLHPGAVSRALVRLREAGFITGEGITRAMEYRATKKKYA